MSDMNWVDGNKSRVTLNTPSGIKRSDGRASCAMVFPAAVNNKKAGFYDPWANDQDWALYYAFKYKTYTERKLNGYVFFL